VVIPHVSSIPEVRHPVIVTHYRRHSRIAHGHV